MPRFFVSKENINEEERIISILGEDAFHIARSLRMAVGDSLTVCDGEGRDYDCTLTKIRDDRVDCDIDEAKLCPAEPPYKATVYQALVKGERLDVAIQKSVEFGASAIVPFESSRCIVRMKGEKEGERMLGATLESLRTEPPKSVAIVVGPEGGFSPEEAERAEKAGLSLLGLGKRILRTESAAAFVLACLSSEFELR